MLFMTGRDLQRITGNSSSRVGYLSTEEIKQLDATHQFLLDSHDKRIPTIEDALKLVSGSVRKVERVRCKNCVVWAKSDSLARDVMKQSTDVTVGYIVMMDPSTGARTNLLRMRDAGVVGIYHPLIDEKVVKILHGRNKKVYAWTVDDKASMQKMLYENVDAIVTSDPTSLQRLMQDVRTTCLEEGFLLSS